MRKTEKFLASTMMTGAIVLQGTMSATQTDTSAKPESYKTIRPFRIHVPAKKLTDLKWRIQANVWPKKEMVFDQSQGVPLAMIRDCQSTH